MRRIIRVVERKQGGVKPGEVRANIRKGRRNLMLSLSGSVEIQAQHGPDQLHRLRDESEDQIR